MGSSISKPAVVEGYNKDDGEDDTVTPPRFFFFFLSQILFCSVCITKCLYFLILCCVYFREFL